MGSIWIVKPETRRMDLTYVDGTGNANPFWIAVAKHLNVGEARQVLTAGWRGVRQPGRNADEGAGTEIAIDWRTQSFARSVAYIKDWSLADDAGKKLPVTRDTIESLNPDVFSLIEDALNAHVSEMEQEKKATAGESSPSTTSA